MISVIIPTLNAAEELPRCFDSLIGAVVRGIVREVIVADAGSEDDTRAIADATGAQFVRSDNTRAAQFAAGARIAKSDWLLFLNPELALEQGWDAEAEAFMTQSTFERPLAASFRLAFDEFGPGARRKETLASLRCVLFGLPSGEHALLISKRLYQKLGGHRAAPITDVDLVRRIGRSRLVMLRARAINKPRARLPQRSPGRLAFLSALRSPS
jgi:glycosyltransferase involved in cell wall biosynthesis